MTWLERYLRVALLLTASFLLFVVHSSGVSEPEASGGHAALVALARTRRAAAAAAARPHVHIPGLAHQTQLLMPPTATELRAAHKHLEEMRVAADLLADLRDVPPSAVEHGRRVALDAVGTLAAATTAAAAAASAASARPCSALVVTLSADAHTAASVAAIRQATSGLVSTAPERLDIVVALPPAAHGDTLLEAVLTRLRARAVVLDKDYSGLNGLVAAASDAVLDDDACILATNGCVSSSALGCH